MRRSPLALLTVSALLSATLLSAEESATAEAQAKETGAVFVPAPETAAEPKAPNETAQADFLIPNAPLLKPTNIITIRAIGLGVAPLNATSRAQEMALAKRSAIIDGYRQLGEKMHGIRINARDTVKDAVLVRSEVRTELYSIVRNAEVVETIWEDGLCQVEMEVKLDGRRWYRVLAGAL